jgi:restriction system protein
MPRRTSTIVKITREYEKQQKAQLRAQQKATKELERARKEYEKQQKINYGEGRKAEVNSKNAELEFRLFELESILQDTLGIDDYINLDSLKKRPYIPTLALKKPQSASYSVLELSGIAKMLPWKKKGYEAEVAKANRRYKSDRETYDKAEKAHQKQVSIISENAKKQHEEIDRFKADFGAGKPDAIVDYFALVLDASDYPDKFPQRAKIAYVPESKQLVIEYDLPPMDVIPEVKIYKYVKSRDEITSTALPKTQRKKLYSSSIAQITLRTVHEVFEADRTNYVENIVFNGYVDSINKSTGQPQRTCLVTVRTTHEHFQSINLALVDPHACLKGLNASVSSKPEELAPVRPVIEFNMVDSRFVEETDVLSELDQRQNLMELTPNEFENLITNLFGKMGLETRQTQASRDGGVDCVAFNLDPILGGKIVIQAKRYKNTVGVSAVRDLYGTLQNEGASKGILVTTSGYGKSSFEFAEGKPIELLSGSHLLHLLEEHTGIKAKIEAPEDWSDPSVS